VEKRKPLALVVGIQTGCSHCGNSMKVPEKIKNRTTI